MIFTKNKYYGTLQAEKGMTWGEWVNSEYNTVGFRYYEVGGIGYGDAYNFGAQSGDIIISGQVYIMINMNAG